MKRLIIPTMLILAVCSIAKAQSGTTSGRNSCSGCSASQMEQIAVREERAKEVAEHNQWPARPQLTRQSEPKYARYARFTANFDFINDADKKIKQVTWECTLVSLTTGQTIARYTLVTRKGIAPHSAAVLSQSVKVPLVSFYPKVVSAGQINQSKYDIPKVVQAEQINLVKEIRYRDGSIGTP